MLAEAGYTSIYIDKNELLETRDKLRDLLTKVDRSDKLEELLEQVLKNTDEIKKLSSEVGAASDKGGNA